MKKHYSCLLLVDSGIGNAIETLYAVEYCLNNNISVGLHLGSITKSFQNYLKTCYGETVITNTLNNVSCQYLIHSFTYHKEITVQHDHYFYIQPDFNSTRYRSETEQTLEIVKALFPSDFSSQILSGLKAEMSPRLQKLQLQDKIVLYPGCAKQNPYKRWPYYYELREKLKPENCLTIGSKDDYDYSYAYCYPKLTSRLLPQAILDNVKFWQLNRRLSLLKPYGHIKAMKDWDQAYFNEFSWSEIVAVFRHCRYMIGNDGGLAHLAAAAGAKGLVIFGPTSIAKNKAYSENMKPIALDLSCQPCQFQAAGIEMKRDFTNCPFQIKCLTQLSLEHILQEMTNDLQGL